MRYGCFIDSVTLIDINVDTDTESHTPHTADGDVGQESARTQQPLLKEQKKTYLSLLPQAQLIELCLAFEQHVPVDAQRELWPANLDAAILALNHPPPQVQDASTSAPPNAPSPS